MNYFTATAIAVSELLYSLIAISREIDFVCWGTLHCTIQNTITQTYAPHNTKERYTLHCTTVCTPQHYTPPQYCSIIDTVTQHVSVTILRACKYIYIYIYICIHVYTMLLQYCAILRAGEKKR